MKNTDNENGQNNPLDECEKDLVNLMKQVSELNRGLRIKDEEYDSNTRKLLLNILDVIDSFESKFDEFAQFESSLESETIKWVNKFQIILKKLNRVIKSSGVTPIEISIGDQFNPNWHNIMEVEITPKFKDAAIIKEIRSGYLWKNKLLRATDIKVAKNN